MGMIVGIAGYMGSGKTTCACHCAEKNGYRLIHADDEAKSMLMQDSVILDRLLAVYGTGILENGVLSFPRLGGVVFRDIRELKRFNMIVHPPLLGYLQSKVCCTDTPVTIVEGALIPLWNIESWFDVRIWVRSSFQTRLSRLQAKKNALGRAETETRMRLQEEVLKEPSERRWKYIFNDGDRDTFLSTVCSFIGERLSIPQDGGSQCEE